MKKAHQEILGKIFAAEMENRLPWQGRSKHLVTLEAEGMISKLKTVLPGPFKVTVEGWELTDLGRYEYCASC